MAYKEALVDHIVKVLSTVELTDEEATRINTAVNKASLDSQSPSV